MNIEGFKKYLIEKGCDILPPTNPYEVVRFKGGYVGVMYNTGRFSSPYAANAYDSFIFNTEWNKDQWIEYDKNS